MNEVQLAWAAGFLDGEGSFLIDRARGPKSPHRPHISCAQADYTEPLERLIAVLGGAVSQSTRRTSTGRTVYTWNLNGMQRVHDACENLIPHLTVKRTQAILLRTFTAVGCHPRDGLSPAEVVRREDLRTSLLNIRKVVA